MSSVRIKAKKKLRNMRRRVPEPDAVSHLNITPMMDMMTILLLFFLKNFGVTKAFTPSEDLMIPASSSRTKDKKAVKVTVTKRAILVEDRHVAAVKKGVVDSSIKRDGSSSFLINPLLDTLQKHAVRLKKLHKMGYGDKFEGEMVLIADQTIPYRLLSEILYTAGQAEYGKYRLLVLQGK